MKKKLVFAAVTALALGAQAGVIALGNDWTDLAQGNGATMTLSSESSSGFTADITRGGTAYQTGFTAEAFGINDTATMSFTTTMDQAAAEDKGMAYRFMMWDDASGGAASVRMDWGEALADDFTMMVGVGDGAGSGNVGTTDGLVQVANVPSNVFNAQGSVVNVSMSVTKKAANLFDVSLTWDDVTISTNGISNGTGDAMDFISGIGIRLVGSAGNDADFTVSNVSVSVIPEPATLGLVAMVGAGLIAIRRLAL